MTVPTKKPIAFIGFLLFVLCLGAAGVLAAGGSGVPSGPGPDSGAFQEHEVVVKARILREISNESVIDPLSRKPTDGRRLKVRITSGTFKGREVVVFHYDTDNPVFNIKVAPGDAVTIALTLKDGRIREAYIVDLLREHQLYILGLLFVLLLLAIGWRKGAQALCSLLLTLLLIWGGLLPGILRGYSPVPLTIVIALAATAITLTVVGGFTMKSLAAILGSLGGVGISGLTALIAGKSAHLTGFGSEEAAMLLHLPQNIQLDVQGLLFAGIIIGALGAAMDVSMSVATAVDEVWRIHPGLGTGQLIRSGMNVGRDIMGTMANTLILAYTGSSMPLILIFMAYRESLLKIINLDIVATEVVRALSGSIGMMMVIPLTAIISGALLGRKARDGNPEPPPSERDYWNTWDGRK
ncbi:putative membrane protein [Hydrogenispora ethanolica]|jgi:uncharacterized membrane protein|uniref:Putative membrane protein n=1 Tax=Hydrogenispora ethanolica TaxID=1082276 RepID=A0A4R1RMK1_HYDET|nr:YibE/F family protein [Hydrogenispora ethanolica]TCL67414.1 putative membrane protein [Hydrogenispora ethanolica]